MSRVWDHSLQKGGDLLVLLALADFANDAGECWPSVPIIAQKARLTERQTQRVLNALESAGEVKRNRSNGGRNRRNRYFITVPENPDKITVTKLQGKNNSEIRDTKTLTPMSPALNRHRTVSKRAHTKSVRDPAVEEFKKSWGTEFQQRFAVAYHFNHGKDGALVKQLLQTFTLEALRDRAVKFFNLDDDWIRTKGGFTIGVFKGQINKLNSTGQLQTSARREMPA